MIADFLVRTGMSFPKWIPLLFLSILMVINTGFAQAPDYIEDDDYVDVYVEPQQGQDGGAGVRGGQGWDAIDQLNTGLLNYGYKESVYYQFSGEGIYKDGNPLSGSFFFNYTWNHIKPLNFKIPPAWAYGAEFLYFSSDSQGVYSGDSDATGSLINMNLYMLSASARLYFLNPKRDFLHPYYGVGWGLFFGDFDTQKITGGTYYTTFTGILAYQIMGISIEILEQAGIMAELKNMRATASTSNDPFNQGNGDSVELMFDGVIIGFTLYYRFN